MIPKQIVKSNTPLPTMAPNPYPIISFLKDAQESKFVVSSGIEIPNATITPVPISEKVYFVEIFSRVASVRFIYIDTHKECVNKVSLARKQVEENSNMCDRQLCKHVHNK